MFYEIFTFKNRYIKTIEVLVKKGNKFLCWDSFKSNWFFGKYELSERLNESKAKELALKFNAKVVEKTVKEI